jgi:hypothetical protein
MIWLWVIPYLIVGVLLSRAMANRSDISTTDAFAIIVVWPLFLVALVIRWVVNIVGSLGGGKR